MTDIDGTPRSVFRLLVTGSRYWPNALAVTTALDAHYLMYGPMLVVVHGACPIGVDAIAHAWCRRLGIEVLRFPADWRHYGRQAGPIRNLAMVVTRPDLCLAFIYRHSPGATHCARTAQAAGIPTTVHRMNGGSW